MPWEAVLESTRTNLGFCLGLPSMTKVLCTMQLDVTPPSSVTGA